MNCLIIEDEPLAAEILQEYISEIPFLNVSETVSDAFKAMAVLKDKKIDIIFLDVNLPRLKGTDFLKSIERNYQVIITTAYRDYALDGFELNVVDFLLKPFSFQRFLTAVDKLKNQSLDVLSERVQIHSNAEPPYIFINVNKKRIRIFYDDILFVESKREYVSIVTKERTHLTKLSLTEIETQLEKNGFLRVHRSFIVSKDKIKAYTATEIEMDGYEIPIGRNFKEQVIREF